MRSLAGALVAAMLLSSCAVGKAVREGDRWMEKERPEAAVRAYQEGLDKKPDNTKLLLRSARALLASGEPEKALAPARAALEAEEEGARAVLGLALVRTHQWDEAVKMLIDALLDSDDPELYAALAEARLSTGQIGLAIESAREAVAVGPQYSALLAYLLARDNQLAEAKELASAAQIGTSDVNILADAAVVLMLARDKAAAQGAASNASQLADADQSEIWAREAEKEYQAGAVELAIRLELRAMMLKPDDPRLAWTAGTWWLEVNEPARAVQLLMGALNNPRYVLGEPDLIQVYQTEGLTFEKRREIRYSIAVTLAEAFRALGSTRDEIEMLREAIAARPAKPVYVRLADLLLAQGRPQEATEALRQAALLDPDDFEISARLARAYAASGDASAALRYGVRAFNANPTDAQTALLVAEIYARSGDLTAAMQILGDAMKATAGHPELEAANARLRQGLDLR